MKDKNKINLSLGNNYGITQFIIGQISLIYRKEKVGALILGLKINLILERFIYQGLFLIT